MAQHSVAVLDVRSYQVTAVVGERGVNRTFVFKANKTEPHMGYDGEGNFLGDDFPEAARRALLSVEQTCGQKIKTLYVGVPGAFTKVLPKDHEISFPKRRKISKKETDMLFESGKEEIEGYRPIRATSMIYVTSDNRRVVDPTGLGSDKLFGALSYFYCQNSFAELVEKTFSGMNLTVKFIPSEYAQAVYLIPSETRDEYALFLDTGYLSCTACLLFGNGILAQTTFWTGRGQLAERIRSAFDVPYEGAEALLNKANLYRTSNAPAEEFYFKGRTYMIQTEKFLDVMKEGLDEICEKVDAFIEECSYKTRELDYKPLYITGEGLEGIRGANEHIAKRINRVCEELVPNLPYYNRASLSSRIALVDVACDDDKRNGFFYRLLNGFGG